MKTTDEPIIVEQTFNSSIETVWNAITVLDEMHKWYFDNILNFKPEVGFETQFSIENEGRIFVHKWIVTDVTPQKMIKYSWEFEEYPGKSTTAFEILREDELTKLRLTVDVLKDFPDNIPEFKRESCIAGWEYFLKNSLKDYLSK
ncbi:MAG: ATPase [Ignavibacteriales bacterium CG12_big_fil_rev_8_21_14_0_65_30_8]|nr:MAG: ATPase [Ignavibacteriales bacterium CG12_big_fil_rev_8_21_14_0_65_30_8]